MKNPSADAKSSFDLNNPTSYLTELFPIFVTLIPASISSGYSNEEK